MQQLFGGLSGGCGGNRLLADREGSGQGPVDDLGDGSAQRLLQGLGGGSSAVGRRRPRLGGGIASDNGAAMRGGQLHVDADGDAGNAIRLAVMGGKVIELDRQIIVGMERVFFPRHRIYAAGGFEALQQRLLCDVRQAVGAKLDLFLGALNSQRPAEIEQARIELTQLIDSVDSTVQF